MMNEHESRTTNANAHRAERRSANRLSTISNYSTASSVNVNGAGTGSTAGGSGWAHRFERLVVVRAPPSQLRHPLNLQVQLINTAAASNHQQYGSSASTATGRNHEGLSRSTTASSAGASSLGTSLSNGLDAGSMHAVAEASVNGGLAGRSSSPSPSARPASSLGASSPAPPMHRSDSSESEFSASRDHPPGAGADLSRSQSMRSTRSVGSTTSSIGSSSTTASYGTNTTGRRVMPCYNLEFHALQDSVVTDAGTDAKVAKIHKKGVEVLGLAMLDPIYLEQADSVPSLQAREEARRLTADSAKNTTGAGAASSAALTGGSDLKPSNLLSKFKRMSFRTSGQTTKEASEQPAARSSKEGKRTSFLFGGGGAGNAVSAAALANAKETQSLTLSKGEVVKPSSQAAPTAALAAYQIPSLPLLRDRSGADPSDVYSQSAGSTEKIAKNLPDGLNPQIRKHATGYAWLVRYYLRKELLEQGSKGNAEAGVAEITVEWRKKRHRTAASRRTRQEESQLQQQQQQQQPNVVIQDRSVSRTPLRQRAAQEAGLSPSRRGSVQFVDETGALVDASAASETQSPPRLNTTGALKTHVQRPSNKSALPTSPVRATQSFDLPRAGSLPLPGSQERPTEPVRSGKESADSSTTSSGAAASLLGYGAQLGRAASLLAPNFLSRHRTAPAPSSPQQHQRSQALEQETPTATSFAATPTSELGSSSRNLETASVLNEREAALQALEGGRAVSPAPSSMLAPMESNSSLEHLDGEHSRPSHEQTRSSTATPDKRASHVSQRNSVRRRSASVHQQQSKRTGDIDDGEESDPEDSERPWICELVIKRPAREDDGYAASTVPRQRILLGTLTPAPHHPKLVAQLAIPLTLSSIPLTSTLNRFDSSLPLRSDSRASSSRPHLDIGEAEFTEGPSLSIEDCKDLFTVTALWLVVRENLGLGGIHKARKNDGAWRFATPAALKAG